VGCAQWKHSRGRTICWSTVHCGEAGLRSDYLDCDPDAPGSTRVEVPVLRYALGTASVPIAPVQVQKTKRTMDAALLKPATDLDLVEVAPGRFELPTSGLGNRCSILLSYGAKRFNYSNLPKRLVKPFTGVSQETNRHFIERLCGPSFEASCLFVEIWRGTQHNGLLVGHHAKFSEIIDTMFACWIWRTTSGAVIRSKRQLCTLAKCVPCCTLKV
jgi:hypothetical protein